MADQISTGEPFVATTVTPEVIEVFRNNLGILPATVDIQMLREQAGLNNAGIASELTRRMRDAYAGRLDEGRLKSMEYTELRRLGYRDVDIINLLADTREPMSITGAPRPDALLEGTARGVTRSAAVVPAAIAAGKLGAAAGTAVLPGPGTVIGAAVGGLGGGAAAYLAGAKVEDLLFPDGSINPDHESMLQAGEVIGDTAAMTPAPYLAGGKLALAGIGRQSRLPFHPAGAYFSVRGRNLPYGRQKIIDPAGRAWEQTVAMAKEHPKLFNASEMSLGSGAALGAYFEVKKRQNQTVEGPQVLQKLGYELVGTLFSPLTYALPLISRGLGGVKNAISGFSAETGRERAEQRAGLILVDALEQMGEDPQALSKALAESTELQDALNLLNQQAPDGTRPIALSAGELTGSKALNILEASLIRGGKLMGAEVEQQVARNLEGTQQVISALFNLKDPALTRFAMQMQDAYIEGLMESRMALALNEAGIARDRIAPPGTSTFENEEAANAQVSLIIKQALTDLKKTEDTLWAATDKTGEASLNNVRDMWQSHLDDYREYMDLPDAGGYPALIKAFMGENGFAMDGYVNQPWGPGQTQQRAVMGTAQNERFFQNPPVSDVDALLRFKRQMGAEAVSASSGANPDFRRARFFSQMENAAREDLTALSAGLPDNPYARASAFSANLNSTFTRTVAGDLQRRVARGDLKIDPLHAADHIFRGLGRPAARRLTEIQQSLDLARRRVTVGLMEGPGGEGADLSREELRSALLKEIMLPISRKTEPDGEDGPLVAQLAYRLVDKDGEADFNALRVWVDSQSTEELVSLMDTVNRNFYREQVQTLGDAEDFLLRDIINRENIFSFQQGPDGTLMRGPDGNPVRRLNETAYNKWLIDNEDVLENFPQLRQDLASAENAEILLRQRDDLNSRARKAMQDRTVFKQFMKGSGYDLDSALAFANATGKEEKGAINFLRQMARAVNNPKLYRSDRFKRRFPEGTSVDDMMARTRQGFLDTVLDRGMMFAGSTDSVNGVNFDAYRAFLFDPPSTGGPSRMRVLQDAGIVDGGYTTRLNTLLTQAGYVQKRAEATGGNVEELLQDAPAAVVDLALRLGGSALGSRLGRALPGRGQGIIEASAGIRFLRNYFEKVPALNLRDTFTRAAQSPEATRMLLDKGLAERFRSGTHNRRGGMRNVKQFLDTMAEIGLVPALSATAASVGSRAAARGSALRAIAADDDPAAPQPVPPPAGPPTTSVSPPAPPAPTMPPPVAPAPTLPPVAAPPVAASMPQRQRYATMFPDDPVSEIIRQQTLPNQAG
tara:strand:+ start:1772 stop:5671 length:3900 start_codon:yes stop_codon:yes gene_type:complete